MLDWATREEIPNVALSQSRNHLVYKMQCTAVNMAASGIFLPQMPWAAHLAS